MSMQYGGRSVRMWGLSCGLVSLSSRARAALSHSERDVTCATQLPLVRSTYEWGGAGGDRGEGGGEGGGRLGGGGRAKTKAAPAEAQAV